MLISLIIGITVGLLLGLTGAGGSVFAVPLLMLILSLSASDAMGATLVAVAFSAGYGAFTQRKLAHWVPALILATGGMLTAPFGRLLANSIREELLMLGFSALAIAIASKMWRDALIYPERAKAIRGTAHQEEPSTFYCRLSNTGVFQLKKQCIAGLIAGGAAIGFASGLFGVGGGFLIVPMLLFLSQIPMHAAIASSLVSITLISGSGFIAHLTTAPELAPQLPFFLVFGSIIGMVLSGIAGKKIAGPTLQKTFAFLLVLISIITLFRRLI